MLPEFNALKENLLSLKDPYEFKLKRECEEKEKVFFETTAAFSVSLE